MSEAVIEKKPVVMSTSKADEFFKNFPKDKVVAYKDYWETVRPKNNDDIFRRYLFSFMSVHTTWKSNVNGYNAIKNFSDWMDDKETLREKIKNSGCGLYNNRTKFIWDFKDQFWANPKDFYKNPKKILGKIIQVQYFEESNNQDGGISLRFPTFKYLYGDKRDI